MIPSGHGNGTKGSWKWLRTAAAFAPVWASQNSFFSIRFHPRTGLFSCWAALSRHQGGFLGKTHPGRVPSHCCSKFLRDPFFSLPLSSGLDASPLNSFLESGVKGDHTFYTTCLPAAAGMSPRRSASWVYLSPLPMLRGALLLVCILYSKSREEFAEGCQKG